MESKNENTIETVLDKIDIDDMLQNAIARIVAAANGGAYPPTKIFETVQTQLKTLQKDLTLTKEQRIELHDVIMTGVFVANLYALFEEANRQSVQILTGVNYSSIGIVKKGNDPLLNKTLSELALIDSSLEQANSLLIIGAAVLFNKNNRALFNPNNYRAPLDQLIPVGIQSRLEGIYIDGCQPKNDYPIAPLSSTGLYNKLKSIPTYEKKEKFIERLFKQLNKEGERANHINSIKKRVDTILSFFKELDAVNKVAIKHGDKPLEFEVETVKAIFRLKPKVKEWLLQGYQLLPSLPIPVIQNITRCVLGVSDKESDKVQKFIVYSTFIATKKSGVLNAVKSKFFSEDAKKEKELRGEKLEKRLMKTPMDKK